MAIHAAVSKQAVKLIKDIDNPIEADYVAFSNAFVMDFAEWYRNVEDIRLFQTTTGISVNPVDAGLATCS